MIIAINLALLSVAFVAVMVARQLRPSSGQLQESDGPQPQGADRMSAFSPDVGGAVEAYAAYLNAPRGILDYEEQLLFDEDMARARAAMERAWLESTPIRELSPPEPVAPPGPGARILLVLGGRGRVARRTRARA
jgi:hypothetical protein